MLKLLALLFPYILVIGVHPSAYADFDKCTDICETVRSDCEDKCQGKGIGCTKPCTADRIVCYKKCERATTGGHASGSASVKIGFSGPLSGAYSSMGRAAYIGAKAGIEDLNARQLVIAGNRIKFELVSADDGMAAIQASGIARRFCDDKVNGAVGSLMPRIADVAEEIYKDCGIVAISLTSRSDSGTSGGFRMFSTDAGYAREIARALDKSIVNGGVAILEPENGSTAVADAFASSLHARGKSVARLKYDRSNADSKIAEIRQKKASAVLLVGLSVQETFPEIGLGFGGIKALYIDGGCLEIGLDVNKLKDILCIEPVKPPGDSPEEKLLRKHVGLTDVGAIGGHTAYAYDAVVTLGRAMQQANSTAPNVYRAFMSEACFVGASGPVAFKPTGDRKGVTFALVSVTNGKRDITHR